VIEDENDSREMVDALLQLNFPGVQVETAVSGEDALASIRKLLPDLLIIDLALPGMDGWTLHNNLTADPQTANIPAIIVSAYVTPSIEQYAHAHGFSGCYAKPLDLPRFIADMQPLLA